MKLLKLTAFGLFIFSFLATTVSCEKDAEKDKANLYIKSDIAMTGAKSVPVSNSTGSGTLSVKYDKRTKLLNYTVTWSGLSANTTSLNISGPAPEGFIAFTPTLSPAPPIVNVKNSAGLPSSINGTYSGSVLIDGVALKEQSLLNYYYYVTLNTTAAYPGGEIRAQISFE